MTKCLGEKVDWMPKEKSLNINKIIMFVKFELSKYNIIRASVK